MLGVLLSFVLLLMVALVGPAMAEDPAVPPPSPWRLTVIPDQWRPGIDPSPALDVPNPVTRDEETQTVTLKEAISLALENNPRIAARRLEPARVQTQVLDAQSQFDPVLGGDVLYGKSVTPNPSALAQTETSVVETRSANAYLRKLFRTGTRLELESLNERLDNNAQFFELRPQYTPQLGFSLVQPILRDFGWDFSYLVVRVQERTAEAAVYAYQAELADFVRDVIRAYLNVVGARANVQVRREALELAETTTRENRARVDVGLLPPVAILEAEADAKAREDDLIRAQNLLEVTRQQLAQLCFYRPLGTFVPRSLEPVEYVEPDQVDVDLDETLDTALADRPEIAASSRGVQARQFTEKIAQNALLPRLDLVGSYGVNGLSGVGRPRAFGSGPVLSDSDTGGCTFLAPNVFSCPPPDPAFSPYAGPQRDAYSRLTGGDFNSYTFGLQLEVPIDNAAAKSQHTRARIETNQAELNHRELLSQVTLEVRQTVADVLSGRQRIDASRVARELAEENVRNQQKRYEVGMATTKDLLDFQQRLTQARVAEVQAHLDYNISVALWRRAQGKLLDYYQIVVAPPSRQRAPWFALF
jgi:outer membrane protein